MDRGKEVELINSITGFLVNRGSYNSSSPIEDMVKENIRGMARDIAKVFVNSVEGLPEFLRKACEDATARALADNAFLKKTVADSVAEALVARYRSDDE